MLGLTKYCSTPDWSYWDLLKDTGKKCLHYSIIRREALEVQFLCLKDGEEIVGESRDPSHIKSTWTMQMSRAFTGNKPSWSD